ncbi:DUF3305 domain-containing protein [Comamonadaceae bacterium M7527]|nr:DUF3305 domain-containing protein [Comamonadaceae bacterium M7527]
MTLARAICNVQVCVSKIAQSHPWVPFRWQLSQVFSVAPGTPLPASTEEHEWAQTEVTLFEDEADGYYLNCTAPHPAWFVHYRLDDALGQDARPDIRFVTLSYNEAGRILDAGETVENLPTDDATARWLADFAQQHFKSEPRKRRRPASFVTPGDRINTGRSGE